MISPVGNKASLINALNKNNQQVKNQETKEVEKKQEDKVAQIAQAIKNGSYKVDIQSTSEKMALNLLNL